jgi:hypothetical protein
MPHSVILRAARRAAALALAGGSLLAPIAVGAAQRTTSIDLDATEKLLWNVNK